MLEKMKHMLAEVDRKLRALAPTKAERDDMIDDVDHRSRCGECNSIIAGRDLASSLLQLSVALEAVERHYTR